MPTYVYKCADNGHIFDLVQKFTDEPGANCPTCGNASTRMVTAPTVIYKGSGFYTTDYGSGASSKNGKSGDESSSSESDSKSSKSKSTSSKSSSKSSSGTSSEKKSSSDGGSSSGGSHSHGGSSHSHGSDSDTH